MVNECLLDKRFSHSKYPQFKLVQVNTNKDCYMLGPPKKFKNNWLHL